MKTKLVKSVPIVLCYSCLKFNFDLFNDLKKLTEHKNCQYCGSSNIEVVDVIR